MRELLYLTTALALASPVLAQPNQVPPQAAAVGYTTQTFGPSVVMGRNWRLWSDACRVTQNSDGTVTIYGGGNGYNAQIQSALPNGKGSFDGTVFGGGGYFEATMSFTGAPVKSGGWPSFWANDIENQVGNGSSHWAGQRRGYVNSIEADFVEFLAGADRYGIALHNWYGMQSDIQAVSTDESGSPVTLPPGTDTSKPHKYGFLWVPATKTNDGHAKWFFDGAQVGNTITWKPYNPTAPSPPVKGSSAYSVMDSRKLYLILGTGPSNPLTVYGVSVWQRTP